MTTHDDPLRIMVVEDDETVCEALTARLIHEGYAVCSAKDAISAVSIARKEKPQVAVLDINLPGGKGFDLVRRLERVMSGTVLKIVFITASKKPGLRQQAMAAGADAFVEKPFTAETLLGAIDTALASEPPQVFG